jgi:hypothetical protein
MKKIADICEKVLGVILTVAVVVWVVALGVAVFNGTLGSAIWLTRWVGNLIGM